MLQECQERATRFTKNTWSQVSSHPGRRTSPMRRESGRENGSGCRVWNVSGRDNDGWATPMANNIITAVA